MKAKILKLAISGAMLFIFTYLLNAQEKNSPFCSSFNNSADNKSEVINARVLMSYSTVVRVDGGDPFIYSPDCNNRDYFAVVDFTNLKNSEKWDKFFEKLPLQKNFIFEINFTGTLNTSLLPTFGHLNWSLANANITEISSIKNVTSNSKIEKPNYKTGKPLREKGEKLKFINEEIIFFFINNQKDKTAASSNIENYFTDDIQITDAKGNQYQKNSYRKFYLKELFNIEDDWNIMTFRITNAVALKDAYEIQGTITNEDKNGVKTTVKYKSVFEYVNNSWVLKRTAFSNL